MFASSFESDQISVPGAATGVVRLLLPVVDQPDARWGLRYALLRQQSGARVEVCLLHVVKRLQYCELFHAGHKPEAPADLDDPSLRFLQEVAAPLTAAGIAVRCMLAAGGAVETILDFAEKLDCHQIVLPLNDRSPLEGFWHRNTVRYIQERKRSVPVVTVDANGIPAMSMHANPVPSPSPHAVSRKRSRASEQRV